MERMERDNRLIDTGRVRKRFTRALDSYDCHAMAQQQITVRAADILKRHLYEQETTGIPLPARCLEIGCGTGGFTRLLQHLLPQADWTLNDLCAESLPHASKHCILPPHLVSGDAEAVDMGTGYGLIASSSAFQWFHDPTGFTRKLAGMQKSKDTLLFSTFAPGNLQEVKEVTGKGLSYPSSGDWAKWLNKYYRLHLCTEEMIRLRFDSPKEVLLHLKYTGVTATGNTLWTRGMQNEFIQRYKELYSTGDKQVTLTYRPLYLLAVRR